MNLLLLTMTLLLSLSANAADLGKSLELDVDPSSGNFQLGVHSVYDAGVMGDKFNISWSILFGTKISHQELGGLPQQVKWNLFDTKTSQYLDTWTNRPYLDKSAVKSGALDADGELAKQVIGNQGSVVVVFGTDKGTPLYNLNVGRFCKSIPTYFMNLTDTSKRCDAVTVFEIETAKRKFCADEAIDLNQYIKDGLIKCDAAKDTFQKKGCGQFSCL